MPLLSTKTLCRDTMLGLWRMCDDEPAMQALLSGTLLSAVLSSCGGVRRRAEIVATHCLLHAMTGDSSLVVGHAADGRPLLSGWHLSVSHTKGYVAIVLSKSRAVAVDIEYVADRVDRVASRFMRGDECATTTVGRLIHWCAKETVFKRFADSRLEFNDMRLRPFDVADSGVLVVDNLKDGVVANVAYRVNESYVLTYMVD